MKKVSILLFLSFSAHTTHHPFEIIESKKQLEQKKKYPDLAFMGKILMSLAGIGYIYLLPLKLSRHHHIDAAAQKKCQAFQHNVFEFSCGICLVGVLGYYIGKKYYPHQDSSLKKNLFSRASLAQKIFNI